MPFTFAAIDLYVSRRVTEVKLCGAVDVLSEFPSALHWISSIGMRSILQAQPNPDIRHAAIQFIRHTERALVCYSEARKELIGLTTDHRTQWSPYFRALSMFEDAISHLYQAFASFMKNFDKRFFQENDGSPIQRLNAIYNAIKHAGARSEQPMWITDTALCTHAAELRFTELEDLMRECARSAAVVARGPGALEPATIDSPDVPASDASGLPQNGS